MKNWKRGGINWNTGGKTVRGVEKLEESWKNWKRVGKTGR